MRLDVHDLGLIEYDACWTLQEQYAREIAAGTKPATLLLLEHPHVYTFGRRGHAGNILLNEEQLVQKGIAVRWVDRGGDVTYHGPGQLVGYPLLPLGKLSEAPANTAESDRDAMRIPQADYVGYVRKLELTLIAALARLGLVAGQLPGLTGVWVQPDVFSRCPRCRPEDRLKPAKVAAIGVKVDSRGISRHGFALNLDPDMSYWDGIVACGLSDYPVTSLAELLFPVPGKRTVKQALIAAFAQVFDLEVHAVAGQSSLSSAA